VRRTLLSLWLLLLLFAARGISAVPVMLRVLTYNIHHGEGIDGRIDLPRLAGVVERTHPDLVALQEVDQGTERASGVLELAELERLTDMHGAFGKAMDYMGGEYGVAVLSRWPLMSAANLPLPTSPDREPRTALTVWVHAGDHGPLVEFTSTHLDQGRDPENRLAQAAYLNERLVHSGGPESILAGDLNARPDAEEIALLDDRWTNPLATDPSPTWPSGRGRSRIDYVLFRPNASWRVVESSVVDEPIASDHRPILVVLECDAPR
jgi:endonuclease/exonuclease/phosphatase family metal-dependent hydrolase